jgi:hypothetical protein
MTHQLLGWPRAGEDPRPIDHEVGHTSDARLLVAAVGGADQRPVVLVLVVRPGGRDVQPHLRRRRRQPHRVLRANPQAVCSARSGRGKYLPTLGIVATADVQGTPRR